jgi:F0F1-type ATP synthase assembly protein I
MENEPTAKDEQANLENKPKKEFKINPFKVLLNFIKIIAVGYVICTYFLIFNKSTALGEHSFYLIIIISCFLPIIYLWIRSNGNMNKIKKVSTSSFNFSLIAFYVIYVLMAIQILFTASHTKLGVSHLVLDILLIFFQSAILLFGLAWIVISIIDKIVKYTVKNKDRN